MGLGCQENSCSQWKQECGMTGERKDDTGVSDTRVIGYVYLIEALGTGLVKVGYSANPKVRLAALTRGSAAWLRLVGSFEKSHEDEQSLHRRFSELREHHEWFRDDGAIRDEFESRATWRPHRERSPSVELQELPQQPIARPYPERGDLKQTLLYQLTWKTINQWLNV